MTTSKLHDVMAYLCAKYPYADDLSKARLTKLVYLSDWRMAIEHGRQITSISWLYNHYGPYVHDVERLALESPDFKIHGDVNMFGSPKETIGVVEGVSWPSLSEDEQTVLDFVIAQTWSLSFADFLNLVYSTYPVVKSKQYAHLDLVTIARRYSNFSTRRDET
jgi:hypothetical protein